MTLLVLLAIALVGFSGLIVLIVGLVEAPWPILLGILTLGLGLMQMLSPQRFTARQPIPDEPQQTSHSPGSPASESPRTSDPEHVYRGVHYTHDPTSAMITPPPSAAVKGTYRGQPWQQANLTAPPPQASQTDLKYRGAKIMQPSEPDQSPPPAL